VSKKRFASVSVTTEIAAGQVTNIDVPLGQNADLQKVPQPNRSSFFHRLFRAYVDDWKLNTVRGADPARREVPRLWMDRPPQALLLRQLRCWRPTPMERGAIFPSGLLAGRRSKQL
jgi:hypothetical protein